MNHPDPLIRDPRWLVDFALCAVVTLVSVVPLSGMSGSIVALSALLTGSLLVRRSHPWIALATGASAALGQLVLSPEPTVSIVAVPILVYTMARWTSGTLPRLTFGLALAGSVLGPTRWALAGSFSSNSLVSAVVMISACAAGIAVIYLIGRRRRESLENQQQRAAAAAEQQRLMIAEQQQRNRSITVEERNRIAREMHDIVAHSLSVIVVQAEGGKALAAKRPEAAPEVLGTIAETSREALTEMRRMVSLLRSGGTEPDRAEFVPTPGLAELAELVRKTSESAELVVFGPTPQVSRALGLTAYRIVQESLTNVLKHAGPAALARVTVAYTAAAVEIEVTDNGRGAAAAGDGVGHGLQGMQERVALHGGTVSAEPRSGGGFTVRAWLPYDGDPAAAPGRPSVVAEVEAATTPSRPLDQFTWVETGY